jgi:uncharacterized Ntn-hydrolase superfamily protein
MTFSIVAADTDAGDWGIAVASKFPCVGAVVPWAIAGAGAVATQSWANTSFGPQGLALMGDGVAADEALDRLLGADEGREDRQVGFVDAAGRSATFTGAKCLEWAGGLTGDGFAAQGNILAGPAVVDGLITGFEQASDRPLAWRLVEALREAQRAGGDRRGQEAAGLLVVAPNAGYGGNHDRMIDLRVDHHAQPIEQLAELLEIHQLLFGQTDPDDVMPVDAGLRARVAGDLRALGHPLADDDIWRSFYDWVLTENLEERWLGDERVDRVVIDHLRERAEAARSVS